MPDGTGGGTLDRERGVAIVNRISVPLVVKKVYFLWSYFLVYTDLHIYLSLIHI